MEVNAPSFSSCNGVRQQQDANGPAAGAAEAQRRDAGPDNALPQLRGQPAGTLVSQQPAVAIPAQCTPGHGPWPAGMV